MKKVILIVVVGLMATFLIFILSGCERVPITPGVIDVKFDDIRWEGDKIVSDIYITNGQDSDQYVESLEIGIYLPDDETEFCAAGYDIRETVESESYLKFEIEFTSEYINMTKEELEALDISLDDLIMHFLYSE